MNSQFLEFMGNYLIQAARWQQQATLPAAVKAPSVMDTVELLKLFRQFFSIGSVQEPEFAEYAQIWQQTAENFHALFSPYAKMWGWVPDADYQMLKSKCAALEKRVQKQDDTISQLRSLLDEKGLGQIELLQRFQALIQDQNNEFQTFMQNLGNAFTETNA